MPNTKPRLFINGYGVADADYKGWTLAGQETGATPISYPATATELYIELSWSGDIAYAYDFMILANTSSVYYMRRSESNNQGVIKKDAQNRTITIQGVSYNGVDRTSAAIIRVFYR